MENSLGDPAWFPDRIDPANRLIRLVRTTRDILSDSAFLDGRTPLSPPGADFLLLDLDRFVTGMADRRADDEPAMRWIFHASFCGSTLLARIATIESRSLCLREPQILVDLANWRATIEARDRPLYEATLAATIAKLGQRWHEEEAVLIKPSNWINSIVADLWQPARGDHALLVGLELETFLIAVLRGGRDRIAYTLQLCRHLSIAWPALGEAINAIMPEGEDAMTRAIRLVASAFWAQNLLFRARCEASSVQGDAIRLGFPDFLKERTVTGDTLNRSLALGCTRAELEASMKRHLPHHSKQADLPVSSLREEAANRQIRENHKAVLAAGDDSAARLCAVEAPVFASVVEAMRAQDSLLAIAKGSTPAG